MQLLLTTLELSIDFVTSIAGQLSGQHLAYFILISLNIFILQIGNK